MVDNVRVLGNYPGITRKRTGLFSFDVAVGSRGELGLPMRTVVELYGYPNAGKSTLSYYIAPKVTEKSVVSICDFESADKDYIKRTAQAAGFAGDVRLADTVDDKGKPQTHEVMLGWVATELADKEVGAIILDSVGAIQPVAEAEGDFGEAFMGKRAKLVAQVSRSFVNTLRNKDRASVAIVINHVHSVIGGRGHITAGGETLKYIAAVRLMIHPREVLTDNEDKVLGFLVQGRVEKLRYGARGGSFTYYIIPEFGVHVGASAMFDCFELGLAERATTVKMGGKSMGYIGKEFLSYAIDGRQRKFAPFLEALEKYEAKLMKDSVVSDGD